MFIHTDLQNLFPINTPSNNRTKHSFIWGFWNWSFIWDLCDLKTRHLQRYCHSRFSPSFFSLKFSVFDNEQVNIPTVLFFFFFNLLFAMQQNSFKYRNHFCMKVPIIFWAQCQSKKCARIPVLYSPVSLVFRDQAVCSNATATLIHDNPPAVREYFTPFPISARAESCCYRNIDLNNLNTVDFLICTWLKIYTTFLREFLFLGRKKYFLRGLKESLDVFKSN